MQARQHSLDFNRICADDAKNNFLMPKGSSQNISSRKSYNIAVKYYNLFPEAPESSDGQIDCTVS
jgi:hypothetical protein